MFFFALYYIFLMQNNLLQRIYSGSLYLGVQELGKGEISQSTKALCLYFKAEGRDKVHGLGCKLQREIILQYFTLSHKRRQWKNLFLQ